MKSIVISRSSEGKYTLKYYLSPGEMIKQTYDSFYGVQRGLRTYEKLYSINLKDCSLCVCHDDDILG